MKKLVLIFALLGLVIGVGQLFYVRDSEVVSREKINSSEIGCQALMPECGYCGAKTEGDVCVSKYNKRLRRFPLAVSGFGILDPNISGIIYLNTPIFVIFSSVLGLVVSRVISRKK